MSSATARGHLLKLGQVKCIDPTCPQSSFEHWHDVAKIEARIEAKRAIVRHNDPNSRGLTLAEQDSLLQDAETLLAAIREVKP